MVAPIYDWTGFYIGANGGWAESRQCLDFFDRFGTAFATGCNKRSGGVIGGQLGYRWQANQFVFGLEAQGDWADLTNTRATLFDPFLSARVKTDAIGLFTGQLGWAWNASLLYVKGGAAVTSNQLNVFDNVTGVNFVSANATRWGAAVGVGWEYGFTPNWTVGVEYDHLFMGNSNNSFNGFTRTTATFLNDRVSQDVDMLTVRFNYRFGGFGGGYGAPGRY